MLDMNISQFLKSLGLEHLRDIFEREQVSYLKMFLKLFEHACITEVEPFSVLFSCFFSLLA